MSLSIVCTDLNSWAAASAIRAGRANDPDSIKALQAAEARFRRLSAMAQADMAELAAYRAAAAARPATKRRIATIGALEFWRLHGLAVQEIIASYGTNWKVVAPFGRTEIVTVPAGWRSCKTDRGTVLKWSKDARVPAAAYWPEGRLPTGLVVVPDYPRDTGAGLAALRQQWLTGRRNLQGTLCWMRSAYACTDDEQMLSMNAQYRKAAIKMVVRLREVRQKLRDAGTTPWASSVLTAHDAAWHRAHGYVWHKDDWHNEMQVRSSAAQSDQIEANRTLSEQAKRRRDNAGVVSATSRRGWPGS